MVIGVPKEIKADENRVALTPAGAGTLVAEGHPVLVESSAGEGSGFTDEEYRKAGARIVSSAADVWSEADLITKVKEPLPEEYRYFREGLVLYTYLHLAPVPELTRALLATGVIAVAYETVQLGDGTLPLLTPMSEVAGRMASQIGAQFLERPYGGRGILLGGVPGVLPAHVVVIGGGTVGQNAAAIAMGMGARVTIIDVSPAKLRQIDDLYHGRVNTLMSTPHNVSQAVAECDLLIGAVLVPGSRAPRLVTEADVRGMQKGSVIVDVAIDQGGSIATIDRVTTHSHPTFEKYGVIHYAVANMPGAVPRTSTLALTNVTFGYLDAMARLGVSEAARRDPALAKGFNVYRGKVTHPAVAEAHDIAYTPLEQAMAS